MSSGEQSQAVIGDVKQVLAPFSGSFASLTGDYNIRFLILEVLRGVGDVLYDTLRGYHATFMITRDDITFHITVDFNWIHRNIREAFSNVLQLEQEVAGDSFRYLGAVDLIYLALTRCFLAGIYSCYRDEFTDEINEAITSTAHLIAGLLDEANRRDESFGNIPIFNAYLVDAWLDVGTTDLDSEED
jgi:hypothetical protein